MKITFQKLKCIDVAMNKENKENWMNNVQDLITIVSDSFVKRRRKDTNRKVNVLINYSNCQNYLWEDKKNISEKTNLFALIVTKNNFDQKTKAWFCFDLNQEMASLFPDNPIAFWWAIDNWVKLIRSSLIDWIGLVSALDLMIRLYS